MACNTSPDSIGLKRVIRLATFCLTLGPAASMPVLGGHLEQKINRAAAGWPVGDFSLRDQRGAPFTQASLPGHWTLLLLEEDCRAPCAAALRALAGMFQRIHATKAIQVLQVVLVSPLNADPPERLGQHVASFDPRFLNARGSLATLQSLANDLGVTPAALAPSPTSSSIWVIGPDGIVRAELLPPYDVLLLTAEFMKIRAHH